MAGIYGDFGSSPGMFGGLPDWLVQQDMAPRGNFDDYWKTMIGGGQGMHESGWPTLGMGQGTGQGPQQVTPQAMQAWRDSTPMSPALAYDAPTGAGRQPLAGMSPPQNPPQAPAQGGYGGDLSAPPIGAPVPQSTFPQNPINPGFGDRLNAGLMGFANAGGPLPAIANLISGMATGQRQDPAGRAEQSQKDYRAAAYQAVMHATGDQAQALAAASNPEVFKALVPQLFAKPVWGVVREGISGDKEYGWIDSNKRTIGPPNAAGGAAGASGATFPQDPILAPGVKEIDQSLVGQPFLDQYSPKFQQAVKDYVAGRSMPTGNPRKGYVQEVKAVAGKYGADIGMPADDSRFAERQTIRKQLSMGNPASLGGQVTTANTSIGHLADLSDAAIGLKNVGTGSFGWLPGSANVARGANMVGNTKGENSPQVNGFNDVRQRYIEEITKFYAGGPGAQAERERALQIFDAARTPEELAAAIRSEAHLMHSKLTPIEQQVRERLGDDELKTHPVIKPQTVEALTRIEKNVATLTGKDTGATQQQPTTAAPQENSTATNPRTGQKIIFKGGQWVPVPAMPANAT